MVKVNLEKLNSLLVRGLGMAGGTRRLFKDCGLELPALAAYERELREAAAEVQQQIREVGADANRPLINGQKGSG